MNRHNEKLFMEWTNEDLIKLARRNLEAFHNEADAFFVNCRCPVPGVAWYMEDISRSHDSLLVPKDGMSPALENEYELLVIRVIMGLGALTLIISDNSKLHELSDNALYLGERAHIFALLFQIMNIIVRHDDFLSLNSLRFGAFLISQREYP